MQIRWKRCVCSICCASQGCNRCCNRAARGNVGSNERNTRISPARAPCCAGRSCRQMWFQTCLPKLLNHHVPFGLTELSCDRVAVCAPASCSGGRQTSDAHSASGFNRVGARTAAAHSLQYRNKGIPSRTFSPRMHPYKLQPPTATRCAGGTEDDLKVTE